MLTSPAKDSRFNSTGFSPAGQPASTQFIDKSTVTNLRTVHGMKRLASCREELELSWGAQSNDLRCVSTEDDSPETNRRVKRRKSCVFESSKRILPWSSQIQQQQQASARPQVKAGWYTGEVDVLGNRHGKGTTKHDDGTEYEGAYFEDLMDGPSARYKFVTTQHLVPNPRHNGSQLHRQIEKSFLGSFKGDRPDGPCMIVTKTTDCAPQVLGSTPINIYFMEIMYDAGMHAEKEVGKAVGEGVRIVYTTSNCGSSSTLEQVCFRLMDGNSTNLQVAPSYARWMLQCMNLQFPSPPTSMY